MHVRVYGLLFLLLCCLMPSLRGWAQCDQMNVKLSSIDCKTAFFSVLVESENIPNGSECTWTLPGGKSRNVCGAFLDTTSKEGTYRVFLRVKLTDGRTCNLVKSIELKKTPKLEFDISPQPICDPNVPVTIKCNNLDVVKASWTITQPGNQIFNVSLQTVQCSYTYKPGKYRVEAKLTERLGCNYVDTLYIDIPDEVNINISATPTKLCAFDGEKDFETSLKADVKTSRPIRKIEWSAPKGNPTSGTGETFKSRYANTNEEITLTVTLEDGCIFTRKANYNFSIAPMIKPVLGGGKDTVCAGDTVYFYNKTTNRPAFGKFSWVTANRDSADTTRAYFVGKEGGTHWVKLAFENKGCRETDSFKVVVLKPDINFKAENEERFVCRAGAVTNITIDPYNAGYTYCWVIKTKSGDTILISPETNDKTFQFTVPKAPESYTFTLFYQAPPPYQCGDSVIKKDFVIALQPKALMDTTREVICYQFAKSFFPKDSSLYKVPALYRWMIQPLDPPGLPVKSLGDTIEAKFQPENVGLHRLTLIISNREGFCPDTIQKYVMVYGGNANITVTPLQVCRRKDGKARIQLSYETTQLYTADSSKVRYLWFLLPEDGSTVIEPSEWNTEWKGKATALVNRDGDYQVYLRIFTPEGCASTVGPILVSIGLRADIDMGPVNCLMRPQTLTANIKVGKPVSYYWQILASDPDQPDLPHPEILSSTETDQKIVIQTTRYGKYLACLRFVGELDTICETAVCKEFDIKPNPSARFKAIGDTLLTCIPQSVDFSAFVAGGATSFRWYFTDERDSVTTASSTSNEYKHLFNRYGVYDVTLVIEYPDGCKDSLLRKNYIKIVPVKALVKSASAVACDGKEIIYQNNSVNADLVRIDFGDGTVKQYAGDVKEIRHTFNVALNHPKDSIRQVFITTIEAYTIKDCGSGLNKDTKTDSVIIYRKPEAGFVVLKNDDCPPYPITLQDASLYGTSIAWDLNRDGVFDEEVGNRNPQLILRPQTQTKYYFAHRVWNLNDCADVAYDSLTLQTGPYPDFTAEEYAGCPGTSVSFREHSESFYPIVSRLWEFGDGVTSTEENPTHVYAKEGNYLVKLTLIDAGGCASTKTSDRPITITSPNADFESNLPVAPALVFFPPEPLLKINSGLSDIVKWEWQFGENQPFEERTPPFEYLLPDKEGQFQVTLRVTDVNGCKNEVSRTYLIREVAIRLPSVFTPNGDGFNDRFYLDFYGTGEPVLKIYDRWGVQIMELVGATALKEGWDGTYKSQPAIEGTYFYYFKIGSYERSGSVTIVR